MGRDLINLLVTNKYVWRMHSDQQKSRSDIERPTQAERSALAEKKMVEATIKLLNTVGFAGTTLVAIGESAGYSRGLATHHFGSKQGLFLKVMKHITWIWTMELQKKTGDKTGLQAILAALDAYRDYSRTLPDHARAMFILWSGSVDPASDFKPNMIEFQRIQREAIAAWVAEGIRDGEIRNDVDPASFGEQFYSSLLGLNYQWLVNPEIDLRKSFEVLKHNIVALIGQTPTEKEEK